MTGMEIFYAWVMAFLAIHIRYYIAFTDTTKKGTPFNLAYWWKDNKKDYIVSLAILVGILIGVNWNVAGDWYYDVVLRDHPLLGIIKVHAGVGFLLGWLGNKTLRGWLKPKR